MMKKVGVYVLIYVLGGLSGILYNYATTGAADRAHIAALEDDVKARTAKLDKCTDALLNVKPGTPPATPPQP
jgi:hypothetical protein